MVEGEKRQDKTSFSSRVKKVSLLPPVRSSRKVAKQLRCFTVQWGVCSSTI